MKKIILTVFAATSLLLYSTPSLAFSISLGMPMGHTVTGKTNGADTHEAGYDAPSGFLIGVQLPFAMGLGMMLSILDVIVQDTRRIVLLVLRYGLFLSSVIFPFPDLSDLLINCPLYLTNFTTDSKSIAPDAYKAVYSPNECPAVAQQNFDISIFL